VPTHAVHVATGPSVSAPRSSTADRANASPAAAAANFAMQGWTPRAGRLASASAADGWRESAVLMAVHPAIPLLVAFLAGFIFGYSTGVQGYWSHGKAFGDLSTLQLGLVVGSVLLGAMIGSLSGGPLADYVGRKKTLVIAGIGTFMFAEIFAVIFFGFSCQSTHHPSRATAAERTEREKTEKQEAEEREITDGSSTGRTRRRYSLHRWIAAVGLRNEALVPAPGPCRPRAVGGHVFGRGTNVRRALADDADDRSFGKLVTDDAEASGDATRYINESTAADRRGVLVTLFQLSICFGLFISYVAILLLQHVPGSWRWMMGLGSVPGLYLAVRSARGGVGVAAVMA
jgi:hypothetical protein